MKQYLNLLQDILDNGEWQENRTGTRSLSVIGRTLEIDCSKCFNLLTTKKMAVKAIIGELLWFMSGSTDIKDLRKLSNLKEEDFCIWQKDLDRANKRQGTHLTDLGFIYGYYWSKQLEKLIDLIKICKEDPTHEANRRLILNSWDFNEHTLNKSNRCALPPCHYSMQFFIRGDKLSLLWNQRSVDTFLGLPFNIASYNLLLKLIADFTGLKEDKIIVSMGDAHIYENHIEQVKTQLTREPLLNQCFVLYPIDLTFDKIKNQEVTANDFTIHEYQSYEKIIGQMS